MENRYGVEQLIHELRDPDWQVRYHAADRLKVLRDPRAVEPLAQVLDDKNLTVRFIAAMTLGNIRDERAVPYLVQVLRINDDPDVLWSATWALTEIGKPATCPLIQLLANGNATACDAATSVLGKLKDPRAVKPLGWTLYKRGVHDYRVTKRFGAADALEQYGREAIPMFEVAARHQNAPLRARAAQAFGHIGHPAGVVPLSALLSDEGRTVSGQKVKDYAARALRKINRTPTLAQ